jgi:hypothetical protein
MNHETDQEDQAFARFVAQELRRSEVVDGATAQRLAAARQRALAVAGKSRRSRRLLVPATAFTAIALLAVAMRPQQHTATAPVIAAPQNLDALDLLTDDMSPTFYRDLEFYRWLEQERPRA